ncbi:hypothetical protein A2478_03130 [Candidatus Falkowbacteria bacterium RIFOXYC2_FULL_36_12]|uniref:Uncharacterized protein n=1 Tax=Candidatus Falkowbacteria bacterium RIFOXYC2_FULL_36_12 TaxID=1798002 RepID=A0A1F5T009_9BACT|nr:MAG: hypothetical protein A2478_03130 [Candidatus Falkowbacteria bacterium RIFOXYC2_FULL_36_12]
MQFSPNLTIFAKTDYRGEGRSFGIKPDDRRRHMYVIGKTGMGKSVLIENMVYSDIMAGNGCALLDPHGDSVEAILKAIPSHRINDVVYINPSDLDFPVAFNVLEKVDPKYRHLISSGIVGVFKKLWADSWGPRLEYLLRNALLALLDYPDSTLLGVNRMFVDKDYRKKVVAKIKDPVVKAFWEDEFTKYNQSFMTEAIAPIQNKVGQFLSTSLIRNLIGQVKSTIDMRKIMDEKKILLVNLAKGRIGEDASAMIGAMMITKIQLAAMSRVDIPENERKDFYLYVDEFQNFSTESFANILSEARKYRLNLIVGHQYVEQLDETVSAAIFGNVGTFIVFRVGAIDAEVLAKEFDPFFLEPDLVNLPKWHIYLKLMIDGVASDPFSAATLPPMAVPSGNEDSVINVSRERYSRPREEVEEKITRWSGVETEDTIKKLEEKLEEKKISKVVDRKIDFLAGYSGKLFEDEVDEAIVNIDEEAGKEEEIFVVNCVSCGAKTTINFKPDGVRPVFCKDCLKDYRRQQAKSQDLVESKKEMANFENKFKSTRVVAPVAVPRRVEPIKVEHRPTVRPMAVEENKPFKELSLKDALSQKVQPISGRRSVPKINFDSERL